MKAWRRTLALSALLLAGCGGGMPGKAPPAAPLEAPAGEYPEQPQQQSYPAPSRSDEGTFAQPPPADAAGPSVKGKDDERDLAAADLELDRAASELSAAGADCPRACKALDSMGRASERICALAPDESSSGRCRRAKERFAEAAGRVRRSCACP